MHFLVFLSALVACAAGVPLNSTSPKLEGRIIGGTVASIEDLPYQVAILLMGGQICGGAIIAKRWVVTAAHCVPDSGFSLQDFQVRAGSALWNSGGTTHQVIRIKRHENYIHNFLPGDNDYDVALMKVSPAFSYNDAVRNIRLEEHEVSEGTPAVVAGWGVSEYNGSQPVYIQNLLQATVHTINDRSCKNIVGDEALITANMICTDTTDGKFPYDLDSGGPLVADNKLVGIAIMAGNYGTTGIPAICTKVSAFLPWIKVQICPFRFFRGCCLFFSGLRT